MDLYKDLVAMRCFTHSDMVRITGSENSALWHIRDYLKKGYIERVRRDLYAVISLETETPIPNRFQIASRIAEDACVSHHSAFEFYGYANQVFYDVYFITSKRVGTFEYDGLHYQPMAWNGDDGITDMNNGVRVTSIERTVIDSIADFEKVGGIEELLRCIMLIPTLDEKKLLEALRMRDRGILYQKTGYVLENFQEELGLSEDFFAECQAHSSGSKAYFSGKNGELMFYKKWRLYAPIRLKDITDKGVDYDAV